MVNPLVPKRLDEATSMVETCTDICPTPAEPQHQLQPLKPSATEWLTNNFWHQTFTVSHLGTSSSSSSVFGTSPAPAPVSAFGSSIPAASEAMTPSDLTPVPPAASAFANLKTMPNVFGNRNFGASSAFGGSGGVWSTTKFYFRFCFWVKFHFLGA